MKKTDRIKYYEELIFISQIVHEVISCSFPEIGIFANYYIGIDLKVLD